jgi:hypothetical protein
VKKGLFILLVLFLTALAVAPAAAVDVKFSGSYYAMGWYVDNPSLLDKNEAPGAASWANNARRGSNAFYSQRFRLQTEFQVVEGLKLVTRFDALEKRWGDQSWAGGTGETQSRTQTPGGVGAAAAKAQENLEWERAYLDFNVPFGKFQVGYMQFLTWGTTFLDTTLTSAGIRYRYNRGPWQAVAALQKRAEYTGLNANNIGVANDSNRDVYDFGAVYKFKPGEAGILYQYSRSGQNKWEQGNGYLTQLNGLYPYAKATFGKLFLEGEAMYAFGDLRSYENTSAAPTGGTAGTNRPGGVSINDPAQNVGVQALGAYAHAKYDLKPAYVGVKFVYLSGDDNSNSDKATGSIMQSQQMNRSFYPTLILWNDDYQNNMGNIQGNVPAGATGANRRTGQNYTISQNMDNVWFYQIYAGIKPMPKMNLMLALSYAMADKKPKSDVGAVGSPGYYNPANRVTEFVSDKYGTELDFIGTYKIYDNLTYMIGIGYLWTGDYFKGYDINTTVRDNYLLSHKLTLNF